ncbi:hypothetical protein AYK21_06355 [Thermoplasmatales archaeon SG8-52-2]|nr:MAG: hypothetical protein AYK21_06355 [Thermoplasmatales archaeon SG8-52-2]
MKNCIDDYGKVAGRIWRTLDKYGPINEKNLFRKIRLNKNDLYAGIGWLARENKISKDGSYYKLSETNLTEKIGIDAGKIWDTLKNYGDINVSSIAKISQLKLEDACTALGWLAREDKLRVNFVNKEPIYNLK